MKQLAPYAKSLMKKLKMAETKAQEERFKRDSAQAGLAEDK
jgi:hypothetical protein